MQFNQVTESAQSGQKVVDFVDLFVAIPRHAPDN